MDKDHVADVLASFQWEVYYGITAPVGLQDLLRKHVRAHPRSFFPLFFLYQGTNAYVEFWASLVSVWGPLDYRCFEIRLPYVTK